MKNITVTAILIALSALLSLTGTGCKPSRKRETIEFLRKFDRAASCQTSYKRKSWIKAHKAFMKKNALLKASDRILQQNAEFSANNIELIRKLEKCEEKQKIRGDRMFYLLLAFLVCIYVCFVALIISFVSLARLDSSDFNKTGE